MTAAKTPTKTQVANALSKLLDETTNHGNRAAIRRTIQIVKGER